MRTLEPGDVPNWSKIDWDRSTATLGRMVSAAASHAWDFEPHIDEDGSVGFSAHADGIGPTSTEEQERRYAEDRQVIIQVFESFEWLVYR